MGAPGLGRGVSDGRFGVLGGTFDPVHLGHLAIAAAVRAELSLEQILFVPAGLPPHKIGRSISSPEDRAAMVALAIAGEPAYELSRVELDRPGPSYTADTVERLAAERGSRPVLILSAESLEDLPGWHEPERILQAADLAVVPRAGFPRRDEAWLRARFPGVPLTARFLEGPELEISSSAIRRRVAEGQPVDALVPAAVIRYIADHGLYEPKEDPATVTKTAASPRDPEAEPQDAPTIGLPSRSTPRPASERPPLELARRIVELAEDKKAADIVLLDLGGSTSVADYFVICSGGSERQLDAIADGIMSKLRDEKVKPIGREGTPASHWILIDFGDVIVHIFTPPEREYYGLERHWSEAKTVVRVQ